MPQNGSLGLKVLSGLESVRESKVDSNTRSKELDFFPVTDRIKATGFFPVRASERWTYSKLLQQTSNIFLFYCLYLQIKRNHHFYSH